ncbi:RxLR effector protein, partial [Phytophthora megakarya]
SKRLLRTTNQPEADANTNDNERMFFIQTLNTPRYMYWFSLGMTPYDVREKLDLLGEWADLKIFKQSLYRGYVKFYDKHCAIPHQSKEEFCRNRVY